VLPSLARDGRGGLLQAERYRTHRAVRALLEALARPKPLVLLLDDLHWADAGSIELLGALLRHPPDASVLIALAARPRQVPERLAAALTRADRAGSLIRLELGALSPADARELIGNGRGAADAKALRSTSCSSATSSGPRTCRAASASATRSCAAAASTGARARAISKRRGRVADRARAPVARLVVDRRTNPRIAAEQFLSQKTVETHMRNLFHKLGVSSRVEVARAIERADRISAGRAPGRDRAAL
jgi:DNA-binding CsgD family transcriptional regulator